MDNPNPIRYSDLIAPDNSITNLISQLDELISKYEGMRAKIQSAAADASRSLQGLSGATDQQRQQIGSLSAESDKLAAQYAKVTNEERNAYRQKQLVVQAQKEQQRIDKLLVEIQTSKEGSYKRLSAQYRLNKIRLNEMTAEERRSTAAGRELEDETRRIYEEMSRLQEATGKYQLNVGHYERALRGLPGPIGQVVGGLGQMRGSLGAISGSSLPLAAKAVNMFSTALTGTIGLILIFVRYLTGAFQTLREFEQKNADLSTILGVSRDGMKALTDSALALGRTTEYTARQVTELQTELAKLGFGQGSIISMEKYILQFATAVGANLADAASVAGATIRAFNLTSSDMEDVLGTLAVATNKSALSFERIRDSIGTVFPVANAFGLSVKDTTALLGALANAGFDASTAATATRNIILHLADANGKLAQRMGGAAKNFDEIIDALIALRKSGVDLNEALELTDKRSVSAFSALLSGAESARELRNALQDVSGELERIEKERLNTVEGATKLLTSAWEGLTLSLQQSNGTIRKTIMQLTTLLQAVQKLLFPEQTAIAGKVDTYMEDVQKRYSRMGAESARAYLDGMMEMLEGRVEALSGKAEKASPLNRWLGTGKAQNELKEARRALEAFKQVRDTMISQMDTDMEEAASRAARELEEAERRANESRSIDEKARKEAQKQRVADLRAVVEAINLEIAVTEAGTDRMLSLRLDKVEAERRLELEQNRQKALSERQTEEAINAKYNKQRIETEKDFNNEVSKLAVRRLQAEQQAIQLEIAITEDGTERMLSLRMDNIEKQREIELAQNAQKAEQERLDEGAINAKYDALRLKEATDFHHKLAERDLTAARELAEAEFGLLDRNERQKTIFRLQQEKARLEAILKLDETASKRMTETEIAAIKATIAGIEKETSSLGYSNLYELLGMGFDSTQQDALNTAIGSIRDSIGGIADAWREAAKAALASADAQVDAAEKTLQAEIEARNAGYANEVETAKKELALARSNQDAARKESERAQRAQLAMDSVTQSSSLITATANIWKSLSGVPGFGTALALAAITTMWGSFAAAKLKAAEATRTEKYGEGTVELLQGGSHASGHDIDLGTRPDGTRRRAEGGEYFAIINKRNSRKYRGIIPDVIKSFNDGSFSRRYQKASTTMAGLALQMSGTDVSSLERDVAAIRRQGEETRYVDGNGTTIIHYRNLTRRIKS